MREFAEGHGFRRLADQDATGHIPHRSEPRQVGRRRNIGLGIENGQRIAAKLQRVPHASRDHGGAAAHPVAGLVSQPERARQSEDEGRRPMPVPAD